MSNYPWTSNWFLDTFLPGCIVLRSVSGALRKVSPGLPGALPERRSATPCRRSPRGGYEVRPKRRRVVGPKPVKTCPHNLLSVVQGDPGKKGTLLGEDHF